MYDFQKANMWKRISAALCDLILLVIVVIGVALFLSSVLGYDTYTEKLQGYYNDYEQKYGVDFDINAAEYEALSEDDKVRFNEISDIFSQDKAVQHTYGMIVNLTLVVITFSILLGYIILEIIVPLLFGNGQTLGKKVFGIGVMREDGVKISPIILFVRTILGKFTVETMIPTLVIIMLYFNVIGIFGPAILSLLLLVQIVLLIINPARMAIHDRLAHTVAVDIASQMIFDTPEALLKYKQDQHAKQVEAAADRIKV